MHVCMYVLCLTIDGLCDTPELFYFVYLID